MSDSKKLTTAAGIPVDDKLGKTVYVQTKRIDIYFGLFLISASTLLLELLQMRVLSVIMYPGLAYIVITFALLGFGISGALLAVSSALRKPDYRPLLSKLCVGYALSALIGVFVAGRLPVSALINLHRKPMHAMAVVIGGLALATPFVFAGLCIGRILMEREEKISVLYSINLVGSGVGCASYPLAVRALGGPGAIVCAAAIGLAASVFFLRRRGKAFAFQSAVACALVAVGLAVSGRVLIIRTHAEKDLSTFQEKERYPDAKLEWSYWSPLCRTDILGSTRYAAVLPDGSEVPRKVVTIDGGAMTYMWGGLTEAQVEACQADYEFMYSFKMLAYLSKRNPEVLLIGVGGGSDVVNAKLHEANSIVGST